jgi:hypothetical protein
MAGGDHMPTHDEIEAAHYAKIKAYTDIPRFGDVWDTSEEPNYWRPLIGQKWEIDEQIYEEKRSEVPARESLPDSFYLGDDISMDVTLNSPEAMGPIGAS